MSSKRKIRKDWQVWSRYLNRLCKLGDGVVCSRGFDKHWNRYARVNIRKVRKEE